MERNGCVTMCCSADEAIKQAFFWFNFWSQSSKESTLVLKILTAFCAALLGNSIDNFLSHADADDLYKLLISSHHAARVGWRVPIVRATTSTTTTKSLPSSSGTSSTYPASAVARVTFVTANRHVDAAITSVLLASINLIPERRQEWTITHPTPFPNTS